LPWRAPTPSSSSQRASSSSSSHAPLSPVGKRASSFSDGSSTRVSSSCVGYGERARSCAGSKDKMQSSSCVASVDSAATRRAARPSEGMREGSQKSASSSAAASSEPAAVGSRRHKTADCVPAPQLPPRVPAHSSGRSRSSSGLNSSGAQRDGRCVAPHDSPTTAVDKMMAAKKDRPGMPIASVEEIVVGMQSRQKSAAAQREALTSLLSICSQSPSNLSRIPLAGGVEAIVNVICSYLCDPDVLVLAFRVLDRLVAYDFRNQVIVGHAGGVAAIVEAMRAQPMNCDVQERACAALVDLMDGNVGNQTRAISARASEALRAAVFAHQGNATLLRQGQALIRQLSGESSSSSATAARQQNSRERGQSHRSGSCDNASSRASSRRREPIKLACGGA